MIQLANGVVRGMASGGSYSSICRCSAATCGDTCCAPSVGQHFGYLQDSVWATPDVPEVIRAQLGDAKVQPDSFLVMEGCPAAGESNAEIVQAAWRFDEINRGYEAYLQHAGERPPSDNRLGGWTRCENELWRSAVLQDPLLPESLLPPDYRGREAWQLRQQVFAQLAARSSGVTR